MRRLLGLTAVAALSGSVIANVAACVGDDPTGSGSTLAGDGSAPAPQGNQGTVDGPCYANGTCNVGLVCKAGRCAPEDAPGDGSTDTTTPDSDGGPDASDDAMDASSDGGRVVCNGAVACTRTIFTASTSYSGNLGGLTGADDKCNAAAGAPSAHATVKSRKFVAFLTDLDGGGPGRHVHGTMPYVRPDGTKVADNWDALLLQDGGVALTAPLNVDETGGNAFKSSATAWTGANQFGTATGNDCSGWTSSSEAGVGEVGATISTSAEWLSKRTDPCDQQRLLYCIEK